LRARRTARFDTMNDLSIPEVLELTQAAAKKRRFLWAIGGNVALLVVMLGGPFVRGIVRAHHAWRDFAAFGACIYGASPLEDGGLGVPIGSEAHFAARLVKPEKGWPDRCVQRLHKILPDQPIFLLPSVKVAENDVRRAAALVERELTAVLVRVPGERMSTRPLRAVEQLRGALSRQALTAGVVDVPADDAIRLDPKRGLPIPTLVPIYASTDARVSLWGADSELSALAIDSNGVSYVHVAFGSMSQTRLTRPKLLEGFLPSEGGGTFVWAMPRARCRERKDGCANKTMGVAQFTPPLSELPLPRWLGAHPAGRLDRSVWSAGTRLLVVAEASEKRRELREFALPGEPVDTATSELPPLAASHSDGAQAADDSWLLTLAGEPVLLSASHQDNRAELARSTGAGLALLAQIEGASEHAWLSGTECTDGAALSFGTEHALVVAQLSAAGVFSAWPALNIGLRDAIHERDPAHDRVKNVCLPGGRALVLVRDRDDKLQAVACEPGAAACKVSLVANNVSSFAQLLLAPELKKNAKERVLIAHAGSKNLAQIQLRELDRQGVLRGEPRTVSACWAPLGGLCGAPLLARLGSRVLLGAREGTNLLMLESPDEGASWEPLRGLKKNH
jgi:hypothetical protein